MRYACVATISLLAGCGHDTTSIDIQFRASGNAGQHTVHLPSYDEERFRAGDHDLEVYTRFSAWYDDVTTFDAARIARVERGHERVAMPFWFTVYTTRAEAPRVRVSSAHVEQAGKTRQCRTRIEDGAPYQRFSCPLRYAPFDITIRYTLDDDEHTRMLHFEPHDFDHSVDNNIRLMIDGV